jgi:hypothetical protein
VDIRYPVDAVGTIITERPPHRSVRALLRIRLPPWMSGEKANDRIRMQNTWSWQPLREDREEPIPRGASLTAAAENEPPQSPHSLPEDTQPVDVSRDRMVAVIAVHNLSQPCTDVGHRLVHSEAQFCFKCMQLRHHAFLRRFPPDDERPVAPALPAMMRKAQEREGLRLPYSTLQSVVARSGAARHQGHHR